MKISLKKHCSVLLAAAALLFAVPFAAQSGSLRVAGQSDARSQMYRTGNTDENRLSHAHLRFDTTNSFEKSWAAMSGLC